MSQTDTAPAARFTVHGDGRYSGDDGSSGELAGMTLYVVRAMSQVDQILGLGQLATFSALGGPQELEATVGHEGDFGLEVTASLRRTTTPGRSTEQRSISATLGDELEHLLEHVTQVELVAGCFVVSSNGNLLADKVPGVERDNLADTGRRMKVTHDAFNRFLSTTRLRAGFEWAQLLAAPVGNGLAVVVADHSCSTDDVFSAVQVGGGVLSGTDLGTFRTNANGLPSR